MTVNYYIGTKDKDTKGYELEFDYCKQAIIEEFAKQYPNGFTITEGTGYYKYDSGEVVIEKTYIATVLDTSSINAGLINALKDKLNQACIGVQIITDGVITMFI